MERRHASVSAAQASHGEYVQYGKGQCRAWRYAPLPLRQDT